MMRERETSGPSKLGIYPRYSEQGASSRLRYYLYRDALTQAGFAPEFHPLLGDEYLRRLYSGLGKSKKLFLKALASRFFRTAALEENLLIEYELLPFLPAAAELLLIGKRKFVLNFDDLVWEKYKTIPFLKNKYDRLIRRAAGVVAANHLLYERAAALKKPREAAIDAICASRFSRCGIFGKMGIDTGARRFDMLYQNHNTTDGGKND